MNTNRRRKIATVVLLLLVAVAGLWLNSGPRFPADSIRNILLISIDTCRADHFGCYGDRRGITPNIDRFAAGAIRFENVIAPVPLTLPSHCTMLTGTDPVTHGVHDNLDYELPDEQVTLAEILRDRGFLTGGLISTFVLDSRFGLDQGFDTYNDQFEEKRTSGHFSERVGSEAARLAIQWLKDHRQERFFYFLHFYDPHDEYVPPEPFATQFAGSPYAGEIAFTDHCVGQVLDELKRLDLYDSTLVIITADHGEMLGEHGEPAHSFFIYQGAVKVPLIVKLPGRGDGKVVAQLAGIVDLVPTICSLLGIDLPAPVQGIDLSPFLLGSPAPLDRTVYCESMMPTKFNANSLLGVVADGWKYIQTTRPELYNLQADPGESENLAEREPERARTMQATLRKILDSAVAGAKNSAGRDTEAIRRLESLGYIGGVEVEEQFEFDSSKDDPKDTLPFYLGHVDVGRLIDRQEYELAKTLCAPLVDKKPDLYLFQDNMGQIEKGLGNLAKAVEHYREAVLLKPEFSEAHNNWGNALYDMGRIQEAIVHYQESLRIDPDLSKAHNNLGTALGDLRRFKEALPHYGQAIEIEPDYAEAWYHRGIALAALGRTQEAIDQYRQAVQIKPDLADAHLFWSEALEALGRFEEAVEHYQQALKIKPEFSKAHVNWGNALARQGKFEEALGHYRRALQIKPDYALAHYNWGRALMRLDRPTDAIPHFQQVLRIRPGFAAAHRAWADALTASGRSDEAVLHYQEAQRIGQGSAPDN